MVSLPAAGMKSLGETLGHQGWNSAKVVEAFDTHGTRKFAHRDPEPREKVVEDTAYEIIFYRNNQSQGKFIEHDRMSLFFQRRYYDQPLVFAL